MSRDLRQPLLRAARIGLVVLAAASWAGASSDSPIDAVPERASPEARLAEIRTRVQAAVVYPPAAIERGIEGVSIVEFQIDPRGDVHGTLLADSSGSTTLDDAALAAPGDAAPLPHLYGRIRIPIRFDLETARAR